jgi:hypothetical protein
MGSHLLKQMLRGPQSVVLDLPAVTNVLSEIPAAMNQRDGHHRDFEVGTGS